MRQDQFRIKKLREREARKKTITVGSRKNEKPKMQKLNSCDDHTIKARKIKLKKQTAPASPEPDLKFQL